MKDYPTIAALTLWLAGCAVGAACGYQSADQKLKRDAIRANAAHYEADQNGDPVFKWGPAQKGNQ